MLGFAASAAASIVATAPSTTHPSIVQSMRRDVRRRWCERRCFQIQSLDELETMAQTIETPLTKLLGIKYPVMLAGMNGMRSNSSSRGRSTACSEQGGRFADSMTFHWHPVSWTFGGYPAWRWQESHTVGLVFLVVLVRVCCALLMCEGGSEDSDGRGTDIAAPTLQWSQAPSWRRLFRTLAVSDPSAGLGKPFPRTSAHHERLCELSEC